MITAHRAADMAKTSAAKNVADDDMQIRVFCAPTGCADERTCVPSRRGVCLPTIVLLRYALAPGPRAQAPPLPANGRPISQW